MKCSSFSPLSGVVTVEETLRSDTVTNYSLNLTIRDLIDSSFPYCIAIRLEAILKDLCLLAKWDINYWANSLNDLIESSANSRAAILNVVGKAQHIIVPYAPI